MKITYTKREKGGYYATTPIGIVIVEPRYCFTIRTNDWVAKWRGGEVVIGTSRKDAVERVINKHTDK
jgi:hypothetical protein